MLYAITDRRMYGLSEAQARGRLLEQAAVWAKSGVALIQLREKDLAARDQVELARAMLRAMRSAREHTNSLSGGVPGARLLINGRPDVALAAGAEGVHLQSGSDAPLITPGEVRSIFAAAGRMQPIISISCHTLLEVEAARQQEVDCILFAPVFEKVVKAVAKPETESVKILPGTGLELLEQACRIAAPAPIFALGGVTAENAAQCLQAGAAGVAAIRLMQEPASVWTRLAR